MANEKSYAGLIIWTICFLLLETACCFLVDIGLVLRCTIQLCSLGVTALVYIIYVTERIYWINGVTFEQAQRATSEQRRQFAMAHLKLFMKFVVPFFFFSCFSYALKLSPWIDFFIGCIGLIVVALATVRIKLET